MKVVILGIDAIEYTLVEQWDLRNLKQEEYGKSILPTRPEDGYFFNEPSTPIIWTSFITGMPPKKHGIDMLDIWRFPLNTFARAIIYKLMERNRIDPTSPDKWNEHKYVADKETIVKKLNRKFNLYWKPTRKDIKVKTMFDTKFRSLPMHIPVYHEDGFPKYKKNIYDAVGNKNYKPIFEMSCVEEFNTRRDEVLEALKDDSWQIYMQYFYVLDGIQHVFFYDTKKIAKYYILFDEFVGKVRKMIDDDTLLLIVSDHGQIKGLHTPYGFYSLSRKLGLEKPKLIDFRWLIEEMLESS